MHLSRLWGFGSLYAKTLRDSRWAILGVAGFLGLTVFGAGGATVTFASAEARAQMLAFARNVPPAMQGMYGKPLQVDLLGGFIAWQYTGFFGLIAGLWSILALSSTLSGELQRGSLDLVLATPLGRRRVVLEKVAAHITAMTIAMAAFAACLCLTGILWARLPGDDIAPAAAAAFALQIGLTALTAGAAAFAISPFLGNRAAAGLGGAVMLGGYVAHGWASAISALGPFAWLSPFHWVRDNVPLAGVYEWPALLALVVATVALLAVGMEGFVRRDIVSASGLRLPGLPRMALGLRGPLGRSFAEQLPVSLAAGIGLAVYGLVMAAASQSFAQSMGQASGMAHMFNEVFPGNDITTPAGAMQAAYTAFAFIVAGLAMAVFVADWASDETSGRLGMILSTPLSRARGAAWSAVAIGLAIALAAGLAVAGVAMGSAMGGADAITASAGTMALGLYAAALGGVGFAVGGLWRASAAGPAVALLAIGTFSLDLFGPILRLPDPICQLALSSHVDGSMRGAWDPVGVGACLILAVAGVALGVWGVRRRDLSR